MPISEELKQKVARWGKDLQAAKVARQRLTEIVDEDRAANRRAEGLAQNLLNEYGKVMVRQGVQQLRESDRLSNVLDEDDRLQKEQEVQWKQEDTAERTGQRK
jgi:hypothetical protein